MLEVALNKQQLPAYTERQSSAQSLTPKNSFLDTSPSVTASAIYKTVSQTSRRVKKRGRLMILVVTVYGTNIWPMRETTWQVEGGLALLSLTDWLLCVIVLACCGIVDWKSTSSHEYPYFGIPLTYNLYPRSSDILDHISPQIISAPDYPFPSFQDDLIYTLVLPHPRRRHPTPRQIP